MCTVLLQDGKNGSISELFFLPSTDWDKAVEERVSIWTKKFAFLTPENKKTYLKNLIAGLSYFRTHLQDVLPLFEPQKAKLPSVRIANFFYRMTTILIAEDFNKRNNSQFVVSPDRRLQFLTKLLEITKIHFNFPGDKTDKGNQTNDPLGVALSTLSKILSNYKPDLDKAKQTVLFLYQWTALTVSAIYFCLTDERQKEPDTNVIKKMAETLKNRYKEDAHDCSELITALQSWILQIQNSRKNPPENFAFNYNKVEVLQFEEEFQRQLEKRKQANEKAEKEAALEKIQSLEEKTSTLLGKLGNHYKNAPNKESENYKDLKNLIETLNDLKNEVKNDQKPREESRKLIAEAEESYENLQKKPNLSSRRQLNFA